MNNEESDKYLADHEKFKEWCALVATGELAAAERLALRRHLAVCEECRALLACYEGPALRRMAAVAAFRDPISAPDAEALAWDQEPAKLQLLAAVASGRMNAPANISQSASGRNGPGPRFLIAGLGAAAALLLGFSFAYQSGYRRGRSSNSGGPAPILSRIPSPNPQLRQEVTKLENERAALEGLLATDRSQLDALAVRATWLEQQIAGWKSSYASLSAQNQQQSRDLTAADSAQETLSRNLADARSSLAPLLTDLSLEEAQEGEFRAHASALESQVSQLTAQLKEEAAMVRRQQQFLAEDRDIRDLMGARQLYIADVFDVDGTGNTQRPFGRVFYTKDKSLVFYAFDLGKGARREEDTAFQAWGSNGLDGSKPVSLGIFYMDDKTNRRWVLRSEDPKVLANLDAVFVTVEPKGGSKKPSGKPFLYAYLHKAPINHS